jgi:hypothetical protein
VDKNGIFHSPIREIILIQEKEFAIVEVPFKGFEGLGESCLIGMGAVSWSDFWPERVRGVAIRIVWFILHR